MKIYTKRRVGISRLFHSSPTGTLNVNELVENTLSNPVFSNVTSAKDDDQNDYSCSDLTNDLMHNLKYKKDVEMDAKLNAVFGATVKNFQKDTTLGSDQFFVAQASFNRHMEEPTPELVYTVETDIIPICRNFIANAASDEDLLANFYFYAKTDTLGVYVRNTAEFEKFLKWLRLHIDLTALPDDTKNVVAEFLREQMDDFTTSYWLRNSFESGNEEMSFPRILLWAVMEYASECAANNKKDSFGLLPFSLKHLFVPQSIVFINVLDHAKPSPSEIHHHWLKLREDLLQPPKQISKGELKKMRSVYGELQRMTWKAEQMIQKDQNPETLQRMRNSVPYNLKNLGSRDYSPKIMSVLRRSKNIASSRNMQRYKKTSFARANRRNPDDINLKGVSNRMRYYPDIHIYVDTSGSITESMFENAVKQIVKLARKLNVDVYFNSFSHCISETELIPIRNRSVPSIWKYIMNIPKVGGGTDIGNVLNFIEGDKKRKKEVSILITDFEDTVRESCIIAHPKNLYYIPSDTNDPDLEHSIRRYAANVSRFFPAIRQHILV